jgi:hypothetical protein
MSIAESRRHHFYPRPIEHVEMIARDLALLSARTAPPQSVHDSAISSAADDLCFVCHLWGNQLLGLIKFRGLGAIEPQIAFFQPFLTFGETKRTGYPLSDS